MNSDKHHDNLFEAQASNGLLVVLRIPTDIDMACQRKLWAKQEGIDPSADPITMVATDLETADWMLVDPDCRQDTDLYKCRCRLVGLVEATEFIDNTQRSKAVVAHLESMAQLVEHRRGLGMMIKSVDEDDELEMDDEELRSTLFTSSGSVIGQAPLSHEEELNLGLERVCSECITDPIPHSVALADLADTKTDELLEFVSVYKMEVKVTSKRRKAAVKNLSDPEKPTPGGES